MRRRSLRTHGRLRRAPRLRPSVGFECLEDRRLLAVSQPGFVESVFIENIDGTPASLTVDQATGDVYFADEYRSEGQLRKVAGDESRAMTTVTSDFTPTWYTTASPTFAGGTDIQHFNDVVYAIVANSTAGTTNASTGQLVSINTSTGATTVLQTISGVGHQAGIEAVAARNAIYFTDGSGQANSLYRYDLATASLTTVATNLPSNAYSLQLNAKDGKLYFARAGEGFFRVDEFPSGAAFVTQISNAPNGIGNFAIDPLGGHLYVRYNSEIYRISLSSGVKEPFATGLRSSYAADVAFGPSSAGTGVSLYSGSGNSILEYSGFSATEAPPQPGEIRGTKWEDLNGDGVRSPNEPPLPNAVIYLDIDRDGSLSINDLQTTTDANGDYSFSDLAPGQYVVRDVLSSQYQQSAPGAGHDYYYGWDYNRGAVLKIDASTGNVSTVLSTNRVPLHGLARTNSGELFGINGTNGTFYRVDLQAGSLTALGIAGMQLAYGLAYDAHEDVIYGLASPYGSEPGNVLLVKFNRANGSVTPVGTTLTPGVMYTSGIAFDAVNRRVVAFDNHDDELYAFDLETGVGAPISIVRPPINMYGLTDDGGNGLVLSTGTHLARVDPTTGQLSPFLPLSEYLYLDSLELVNEEDFAYRVSVVDGGVVSGINFGNQSALGSIGGTKWNDLNGNGLRDSGEPPLANVSLYIDVNENGHVDDGEPQTTSSTDGTYQFSGLAPGRYIVRDVTLEDFRQTSPGVQTDYYWGYDRTTRRVVKVDAVTATVTPIGAQGSIGVNVDMHGLAMTRDGELYAISGWDNSLYKIDTNSGTASKIRWTGLTLAWGLAYDVSTDTLYGLATPPGFAQGSVQPIVYDRQTGGAKFIGNQVTSNVSSTSGIAFDPVTRRLLAFDNSDREIISFDVVTGVGTSLVANLPNGAMGMAEDGSGKLVLATNSGFWALDPQTWNMTPLTGPLGNTLLEALEFVPREDLGHTVYLGAAENVRGIDFGSQSVLGDIQGKKWEDRNGDGQQNADEPAMPNVVLYLDANNNGHLDSGERSTITSADGSYVFTALDPGQYIVREVLSYGHEQTSPGVRRDFYWGYDAQQRRIVKIDAANGQATPIGVSGSIGSGVNIHGMIQAKDGLLFGINLSDSGFYSIDANTGLATRVGYTGVALAGGLTYDPVADIIYGAAAPRSGPRTSLQLITIDRRSGVVTFIGNEATANITGTGGMAFDPLTQSVLLYDRSLGGRLFSFDSNTGVSQVLREQISRPAAGMSYDSPGNVVLAAAGQLIQLNISTGELFTLATFSQSVSPEALEEVRYSANAHTVYLGPAQSVSGVNFGSRSVVSSISGTKFEDRNGDGIRQSDENPLIGFTVYLDLDFDENQGGDEPVTTTDEFGSYSFSNLLPGRYVVRDILPTGYVSSPVKSPSDYYLGYDVRTKEIVSIDPTTGAVTTRLSLANYPIFNGIVRTNANELIALNGNSNTLYKIDIGTGAVTTLGSARHRVAWGLAYDAVSDKVYGLAHPTSNLEEIALAEYDRTTGEAIIIGEPITGVRYTSGLTFDPVKRKIIAFDNSTEREIYAFDPETGTGQLLSAVATGVGGFGLAADNTGNLILDTGSGTFVRLDTSTGQWSPYLHLSRAVALEGLEFVDFANGGHDLYLLPGSRAIGNDFGNQNIAPSNLTLTTSTPIREASAMTLNGSFTDPGSFEAHTVTIHWGSNVTETILLEPGITSFTASRTFADNEGPITVVADVFDSSGGSTIASNTFTVENVAPAVTVAGHAAAVRGQTRSFTLTATDASSVDQAGNFIYSIDWGDGTARQVVSGPAQLKIDHLYSASGNFLMAVTVTDKDGGKSTPFTKPISVSAVALQEGTLVVGGTIGSDSIVLKPSGSSNGVTVSINGLTQGTFQPTGRILVYAQAGDDNVLYQAVKTKSSTLYITASSIIDGGTGNDTIDVRGSIASNVLLGGAGVDTLWAGNGRDLMIGGLDRDTLRGQGGDDILIGGTTDFDRNLEAQIALLAEWSRSDLSYQSRWTHLSGGSGGLNQGYFLTSSTVHDDSAVDQLFGDTNQDWFFFRPSGPFADTVKDRKADERTTSV